MKMALSCSANPIYELELLPIHCHFFVGVDLQILTCGILP